MRPARLTLSALVVAGLPGCFWVTTKDEGDVMRRDIAVLKSQQAEQGQSLDERTKKLDSALEKTTKFLATNSADLGVQVDKLSQDQAAQAGQLELLAREVVSLRAQVDALKAENAELRTKVATPPPPPTVDKDALFARAQASLKGGQYTDSQRDFREFLRLYSNDERADDAQFGLGEIWFRQKQFERAIAEFQRVIDAWPQGDQAAPAFFRAGEAALEMKWCVDARAYFGVLGQRYPKSEQAKAAKAKLDFIKKNAGNKAICTP